MGGEKPFLFYGGSSDSGSPPHRRGKEPECFFGLVSYRITPAWAGKRTTTSLITSMAKDHPRVGGEKARPCIAPPPCRGSPPRGRGKGGHFPGRVRPQRITPAWAGKSGRTSGRTRPVRDHPRVGGEKAELNSQLSILGGSPPRGRGKVLFTFWIILHLGITPAWAGKRAVPRKNGCPGGDHPRVGGEKHIVSCGSAVLLGSPPRGRGKV